VNVAFHQTISLWLSSLFVHVILQSSGVAIPNIWGPKYFDFERATLFCLGHRLLKRKTTRNAKIFLGSWPPWAPLATPMLQSYRSLCAVVPVLTDFMSFLFRSMSHGHGSLRSRVQSFLLPPIAQTPQK